MILAIETSCDDTCAAVVSQDRKILSSVVSSQAKLHDRFGGVVPEVASRHHLELVNSAVDAALIEAGIEKGELGAVAVTTGPGLIGALLIGVTTAKAFASALGLPLVPVNHLYGHIASNFAQPGPFDPPFLCMVVSGGHTLLAHVASYDRIDVLGQTLDDAAGEAFDKGARLLGLPYPGGVELERLAEGRSGDLFEFPVGLKGSKELIFSFSGLKTALAYKLKEMAAAEIERVKPDLAASYQQAICSQLIGRIELAVDMYGVKRVAIAGGVAANGTFRQMFGEFAGQRGLETNIPARELCTDNAAMIGLAATTLPAVEFPSYLDLDAFSVGAADLLTAAA